MFEIGASLREARLRQGLDIRDAEQATKIRTKYLKALEDETFDVLPAETYVRGFLRAYAEHLGLDGQLYVDEYNSRFVGVEEDLSQLRARRTATTTRARRQKREGNLVVAALAAIAVVTALVIAAWRFGGGEDESIPGLERAQPRARAQQPAVRRPPAVQRPAARPTTTRLLVRAVRGDSWLEAHAGSQTGRLLYQGTLERGQQQLFNARRIWVNIGIPGNVSLRVNGRAVRLLPQSRPTPFLVTPTGVTPVSRTT